MTKKVELPSLERRQRRPAGFWQMFNVWWRKELDNAGGIRPPTSAVRKWYQEHAEAVWPDASTRPCWRDCRVHAKCLKSTEEVKEYFRKYRCGKKPGANGTEQARGRTANESNSDSDAGEDEIASNYAAGRVQPVRQYANQVSAFPLGGLPGAAVLMHSLGLGQKLQASSAPTWTPVGMPAAATPLSLPAGTGEETRAGAGPRPKHKPDTLMGALGMGVPPQAGIGTSRPPPGATGLAPVLQPWHQGELARLAQLQNIKLEGNLGVSCPLVPPASQMAVPSAPLLRPVRIRPAGHSSAPGGSAGAANLVGMTKAGGHDGQLQAAGLPVLPVESVSGLLSNAVTREQPASHAPDSPWKPDLPACVSASALASIVKEEQHTRTYQPGNRPPTPLSFSRPASPDNPGLWHTANDGLRAQLCSKPAVQQLLWAPQAAPDTVPTPDTAKAAARSLAGGHQGVAEASSAPCPSILSFGCKAGTSFGIHGCGDCEMEEQKQMLPFPFEQKHPVGLEHGAHETQLVPLPSWIPAPLSAPPLTSSDHHHFPALVPHLPISTRRSQPWPTSCEPPACMDPGAWVTAARRSSERNSHASHDGGAHEDMFDDRGQAVLDGCGVELGTDMAGYSAAAAAAAAGAEPPFLYPASPVRPSATLQRLRSRGSQPVTFTPFSGRSLRPDRSRWEQGMLAPASSPLAQCGSLEPAPSLLHPRTSSLHLQSALSSHSSDPGPFAPGAARLRAAEAQLLQAWHQADSGQLELRQHIQQQLDQVYREQRDWQQQRLRLQDRQQQMLQASGSRPHHHHHHPRQQQKQQLKQQPNHHWQAQAAEQQQQSTALEQPQYSQYTPAKQMLFQGQRSWGRQTQPLPQPQTQLPSGPDPIHFMSRQPSLKQHQQLQLRPLESQPLSLDLAQLHCQQRQDQQQQQQQQRPQASQPVPVPSDALWQLLMSESELGGNGSAAEATCVRGNAADSWLTTLKPAQHPALASARSSPTSVPNATSNPGTAGAHQATPPSQPQPSTATANAVPPYHPQQAQTAAALQATLSPLPPHPVPDSPATDDKPTIGSLSADPKAPQVTAATMPSSPTPSSPLPTLHCARLSSPPLHSLPSSISDHAHSLRGLLDTVSGSLPACSTQAAADSPEQSPGSAAKQHHTPPCDSSAAPCHVGPADNSAAAQLASSASPAKVPSSAAHEHMSVRSSCGKTPPAVKEQVHSVLGCYDAVALIQGSALATAGQSVQAAPSAAIDMQPRDPVLPVAQDTLHPSTAAQQDPSGAGEAGPATLLSDHPCQAPLVVASGAGEEDPPSCVQAGYEAAAAAGLPAARGELGTVPSPRLALSACLRSISSRADRVAGATGPCLENPGSDPPPTPALELAAWLDTEAGNAVPPSPKVCDMAEVAVSMRSSPATALITGFGTHGPAEAAVEGVVAATKVMIATAADQSTSALCCAPPAVPVTQRVNQRRSWADAQMDDSWGEDHHQQQQQHRQPPLLRAWGSLQPSSPAAAAHNGGRADPFLDLATEVAERWAAAQQERMRRSSLGISVPLPLQSPDHRSARQCQPLCPMPDPAHVRQLPARWQDSQASAAQASEFWLQAMQPSAPHQHQRHYAEEVEPRQSLRPSHPTQTSLSSHHLPGSHSHNCLAQLQPLSHELSRAPWAQPDRGGSYGAYDQPHHSLVMLQQAPHQAELVGQQNWHRHTHTPLPRFEAPRSAPLCTTVPYSSSSSSTPQLPGQQARRGEAGQMQARPALQLHTRQHQHWLEQELELALQDAINTGRRASGHADELHGQAPSWYHPAAAEGAAGEEQGVPRQWPAGQGSNGSQGSALHYTILPQEASMPRQYMPPQPALESGWAPLPAHQGLGGWRIGSMVKHEPRAQYESEQHQQQQQQQQQQQLQQAGSIRQPSMAWQVLELHDMLEDSGHLPRLRVEQQQSGQLLQQQQSRQYPPQQRHVGQYMHMQQQQQQLGQHIQRQQEQQEQWLMQAPGSPPAAPQTGPRQVHASAGRLCSWVEAAGCHPPSCTLPQALPAPMSMAALDAPHPQQLRLQSQGGMAMDIDPGMPAAGAEDLASFF